MTKVTGPLLSMEASGSIGGAMTFARWKGRPYVRMLVKPSNPKSDAQTTQRAMMRFLAQVWGTLGAPTHATWQELADAGKYSTFNAFVAANLQAWTQGQTPEAQYNNAADSVDPLTIASATAGVKQAEITLTAGDTAWGALIHRSVTAGFAPSKATVVGVIQYAGVATAKFVDPGLITGTTYYYRVEGFSRSRATSAPSAESSVTAL